MDYGNLPILQVVDSAAVSDLDIAVAVQANDKIAVDCGSQMDCGMLQPHYSADYARLLYSETRTHENGRQLEDAQKNSANMTQGNLRPSTEEQHQGKWYLESAKR